VGLVHFRYKISRRLARLRRFVRHDNGFTLTELVIAMVVLSILSSIVIPSFLGSRNNAYDKEAQTSIEVVLRAAKFHYQSQGDFSDGSSAQCGDSAGLAADLQKLEPNVDVVASSVSSTNARIISVQAVQTWSSNAELLGCQGFYAVALSSSGSCWAARVILEGKYLASGSVSPVVVNAQTNTSNSAVTTWSALAVNGQAFAVLKPQTSAADGDNTNGLVAIKTACKAKTHSTGVATTSSNYIAPSQFYSSWRETTTGGTASTLTACAPTSSTSGGFTTLSFTSTGTCTWVVPTGVTEVRTLVVGGGGGSGGGGCEWAFTRGGGGGGVTRTPSNAVTASTNVTVVVGSGGKAAVDRVPCGDPGVATVGTQGGTSSFASISSTGGFSSPQYGSLGGASGVGENSSFAASGLAGTATDHGCVPNPDCMGGGGGGAGGAAGQMPGGDGSWGSTNNRSGTGGLGLLSDISGTSLAYGAGAFGTGFGTFGTNYACGGSGGAGYFGASYEGGGCWNGTAIVAPLANRGGGGVERDGGSGVVIVKYVTP